MKTFAIILFLAGLIFAEDPLGDYSISKALESEDVLMQYVKCLLDEGPCMEEMKKLKELIPSVLESKCEKCTEDQKQLGKTAIQLLKASYPKLWSDLQAHYDPEGKYLELVEAFLSS